MTKITRIFPALLLAVTSCAATPPVMPQTLVVTKTIYVPWVWPEYLKRCAANPPPVVTPHILAADPHAGSKVAHDVVGLRADDAQARAVADDCRNTLAMAVQANAGTVAP